MNNKFLSSVRFNLTSSRVNETELCLRFGTNRIEDIDDSKYREILAFLFELKTRIRKDRKRAYHKARYRNIKAYESTYCL